MRFERKSEKERKPEILTAKHEAVLEHTYLARYMTANLITELVFKPTEASWAREHLRDLFHWGYLKKREVPLTKPDVFFLGVKGKRWAADRGYCGEEEANKVAGVPGRYEAPLPHDLTLSLLYARGVVECRRLGLDFAWKNTRMLELEKLGVQPDAHVKLARTTSVEAYVEFTDVLPLKSELSARLNRYVALWQRTEYQPILWFTTTEAKRNWLFKEMTTFSYCSFIFLGLIEDATDYLTGHIWRWSEADGPANWVNFEP